MPDIAQLAALAAIHRHGSFDRAATVLSVTPSAISQRIRALEEQVGTLLLHRGPPVTATPAGLRLIRHHEEITLLENDLSRDLPGLTQGPPILRIAVNADSLATWVLPALAATPGFLFDLVIDDQDVSQDWLRRGEVVAAITAHHGPPQGCDTHSLGAMRYRATASPGFVARWFPKGLTAEALSQAPALVFSQKDRLQDIWAARQTGAHGLTFPSHRLGSSEGFIAACRMGLGWAMNAEPLAAAAMETGELVEISPNTPLDIPLYWQMTRLAKPALRELTQAIRAAAARHLIPPD